MSLPSRWLAAALVVIGLAVPTTAHAIITRDDVPDSEYLVPDADEPALVDLFGPGDCIGTLIAPSFVLTVAHCAEDMHAGATLVVSGVEHDVAEVILHPKWKHFTYDVALIRFEVPVTGVDPIPFYRDRDEEGRTITLFGRGVHGTGLVGEHGGTDDGKLRHATNVVTNANDQWIEVFFEHPDDPGVTPLEGVGAAGDSGAPAFIETADGRFIAGLNSWGDAHPYSDIGKYGAWDDSTRVSSFAGWIDSEVGTAPAGSGSDPSPRSTAGCGCDSAPATGAAGWWGALILVAIRRLDARRRSRRVDAPSS